MYAVDVATDPKAPKLAHIAEPEAIRDATGLAYLHTSHCLGSGEIMISAMGDPEGNPRVRARAVLCGAAAGRGTVGAWGTAEHKH